MENSQLEEVARFIKAVLSTINPLIDKEAIDNVEHYLNHDEYEMAFEGLFIEVMNLPFKPNINYVKAMYFGLLLKLDKDSVFDVDFWSKFKELCE